MTTTPTETRTVKLGNVVKDPVSGFQGTAIQYVELLNGTVQFAVQPSCDPKEPHKLPDAYNFDTHLLEFVEAGSEAKVTPPSPNVKVRLGDKVRDQITGIEGTAVIKAVFINGCTYFTVQPEKTDDKATDVPKSIFVSHDRLDILRSAAPVEPPPIPTTRSPGGPTTRAERMS